MDELATVAARELEHERQREKRKVLVSGSSGALGRPRRAHEMRQLKKGVHKLAPVSRRRARNPEVDVQGYLQAAMTGPIFSDKVVVITGASSGIGLETMRHFLRHGAVVVNGDLTPPDPEDSEELAQYGDRCRFVKTDVRIWDDVVGLFRPLPHVDIVVANAGVGEIDTFFGEHTLEDDSFETLEVDVFGTVRTVKMALQAFRQNTNKNSPSYDPHIVLLGSVVSYHTFGIPSYTAAKHAIVGLIRGLRDELSVQSIRINAVAPKWTQTKMTPQIILNAQTTESVADAIIYLCVNKDYHGNVLSVVEGKYHELETFYDESMDDVFGLEYP